MHTRFAQHYRCYAADHTQNTPLAKRRCRSRRSSVAVARDSKIDLYRCRTVEYSYQRLLLLCMRDPRSTTDAADHTQNTLCDERRRKSRRPSIAVGRDSQIDLCRCHTEDYSHHQSPLLCIRAPRNAMQITHKTLLVMSEDARSPAVYCGG